MTENAIFDFGKIANLNANGNFHFGQTLYTKYVQAKVAQPKICFDLKIVEVPAQKYFHFNETLLSYQQTIVLGLQKTEFKGSWSQGCTCIYVAS